MNTLWVLAWQNFRMLRRDHIFLPALIIGSGFLIFAQIAAMWGIEDYHKFLYDVGATGYHLSGVTVAILWGTKSVADSKNEGSLESELAQPISRSLWLWSKFLGLIMALSFLALLLIIIWQLSFLMSNQSLFQTRSLVIQATLTLGWFVVAAISIFFAAIASPAIAMFASAIAWLSAMISNPISHTLGPDTPEYFKKIIVGFAELWDLSRFNLSEYALSKPLPPTEEILWIYVYGFSLVIGLMCLASIFFEKRELG